MAQSTKLNTTAYSLLGLLSKKSWTAYELAQFMEFSVIGYIMPRSRSLLFTEPKRLVSLGLATATAEHASSRHRTRYHITERGRETLRAWLSTPGENMKLEYKSLLKFYMTDPMDTSALLGRVREMREHTLTTASEALKNINHILEEGVLLQDSASAASVISQFAAKQMESRLAWLDDVERWLRSRSNDTDLEALSMARYARTKNRLEALLTRYDFENEEQQPAQPVN